MSARKKWRKLTLTRKTLRLRSCTHFSRPWRSMSCIIAADLLLHCRCDLCSTIFTITGTFLFFASDNQLTFILEGRTLWGVCLVLSKCSHDYGEPFFCRSFLIALSGYAWLANSRRVRWVAVARRTGTIARHFLVLMHAGWLPQSLRSHWRPRKFLGILISDTTKLLFAKQIRC